MMTALGKLNTFIKYRLDVSRGTALTLSVLGVISFPVFLVLYPRTESYWIDIGGFLASLAVLSGYLFNRKNFHYYWLVFVIYVFPFNFTYNYLSYIDSTIYATGVTIMLMGVPILVTDFLMSVVIILVGITAGYLLSDVNPIKLYDNLFNGLIYSYILAFLIALGLMQNQRKDFLNKIKAILAISHAIAHEIKTPVTAIKLYNDDLKPLAAKETAPKRLKLAVGVIDRQLNNITNTTDFLLLNARSEHLPYSVQLESLSMYDCITSALDDYPYQNRFALHDIKWTQSEDFMFYGDNTLMRNVLFNLIKNAIRSILNKGQGEIYISNHRNKKFNYLVFRDTGMGAKKQDLKKLFNSFFTTGESGSGLGLFFCKNVIHQFGGEIAVSSVYQEQFTVTLKVPICR